MKIVNKISISFFTIVLLLISVAGFIFYRIVEHDLRNRIFAHLVATAQSKAAHIETFLEAQEETIKQMSKSIILEQFLLAKKGDKNYKHRLDDANRRLRRTIENARYIYDIFLLNKKGIIIVSSTQEDIGKDKSNDAYFLGEKEGIIIKDAYISSEKKVPTIAFSIPMMDKENINFIGVVVMRYSMQAINEITTSRTGLGKTGEIYLVNKDGFMITPSRFMENTFLELRVDSEGAKKCLGDMEKFGKEEHEHESFIYKNYRNVPVLGVHNHIDYLPWGLIVEMGEKEAFAPLVRLKVLFLSMVFIVSMIAWMGGYLLAKHIILPLKKLEMGVEKIGKGDLDCRVATQEKDEIGQLSRAFNKMTQDLKNTTTSVRRLNQEIIQRREAEERLQLFSHAVESAIEGIAMGNLSGEINYINESLVKMFGYSKEEIIGKKISFLYDDEQFPRLQEALKETMKGGWKGELVGKRKDGTLFPVELHSSIVKDIKGRVIAQMVTHTDISERKQTEEKIKQGAKEWEETFNVMEDCIFIMDGEQNILKTNRAFNQLVKRKSEKIIGKKCYRIIHNLETAIPNCVFLKAKRSKKMCSLELKSKETNVCLLASAVPLFDQQEKVIGAVHVIRDITPFKLAEEKMKESIRVKSDFLSMVSHELRTPLTAIKEGIGIVLDGSAGEINAEQEDFLDTAKRNVDRLHRLINQVLDFSKLEARKAEFMMEERDINQTIKEIVKMQQPVAKDKGLYVKLDLGDNLDKLLFDVDKISQVLTNLTNNALRHTEKGGITVSSKKDTDGEFIRVGIKDTGQGIKTEDLNKLFQQFQQVGEKFRKPGSTGLGLAISKEIVNGHKGKIWVESQYSVGSEFVFTLPIVNEKRDKG